MFDQKYLHPLILLTSILLSGCELHVDPSSEVAPNYTLLSACDKPENSLLANIIEESLCGTISVFEDRSTMSGRKIDLNIMLLPATTSVVRPDPIFFLAGGPGQSAVSSGPSLFYRLHKLRRERDIVLVDQRGTGKSNSLACELDISMLEQLNLTIDEVTALQLEKLKKCLPEYDANPALYTTPIAMDDLNEVRETLGYDKINLLGISYGTRAGLVYLRRHGDTVRSAVLDAVVPMTMAIPENIAIDAQSAFNKLLEDCERQPGCQQAYPDLGIHFKDLVKRLEISPEEIAITHPRTGVVTSGTIDPLLISRLTRGIMYDRTLSRLLPLAIEEAFKGNYQPLSTLAYTMNGEDNQLSTGMMVSVLCAEDMKLVHSPNNAADFDNPLYHLVAAACEFWPAGSVADDYFTPVTSDVPVLLTSGTLDPITPPRYGWEAAATLSNSEHLVVPGVGHGTVIAGCMPDVVSDFFDKPDPRNVKATCSMNLHRPPFFTSYAGALQKDLERDSKND